ncbi:response regulator [Teredinibacter turnerae]|uniref:response regulator n=1 Tax=Teredinibacter turnerae TaxID=2426 RepID=UPI0030D38725
MIKYMMIVDDNEADHAIAQFAVDEVDADIQLYSAYDGQEALDLLDAMSPPPDLIFLDISMPGMSGHEFLAEYAKRKNLCAVVVMLTSSDQPTDKSRCMQYTFVRDYLLKPLDGAYLNELIKAL